MLKLNQFKSENSNLSVDLLNYLKKELNLINFIETGTYLGDTTAAAAAIFFNIYSVELSELLYKQAAVKLKKFDNIQLYQGDSTLILPEILKNVKSDILFWLDGHYSEGFTAKGDKSTPILEELEAIFKANLQNFAILIDDMRIFQAAQPNNPESLIGYPEANELSLLIARNLPNAELKIIGDIALITNSENKIKFSKVIDAITESRLFSRERATNPKIIYFEKIIANAQKDEKDTLIRISSDYSSTEKYGLGSHYRLWKALIEARNENYAVALEDLFQAKNLGLSPKRIAQYETAILNNDVDFFKNGNTIKMLSANDLFYDESIPVKSPDDLLIKMKENEIFKTAENIIFAGVHKYQEKELIESIFPNFKKIILLEAIPSIAENLQRDLQDDSRYIVVKAALSDKSGMAEFHITDNEAMSSSLLELGNHVKLFPYVHKMDVIKVNTVTLEEVMLDNNLQSCDALILDVQGAELQILSSLEYHILEKIHFIYTEVSKIEIYKNAGKLSEINALLKHNFVFAGYAPNTNDVPEHGNALYINYEIAAENYQYISLPLITDNILIATTISPKNINIQQDAIQSWINVGFEVVSINLQEEIDYLESLFPVVNFVKAEITSERITGKSLIYFDSIRNYLIERNFQYVAIINSDIFLEAGTEFIEFLINNLDNSTIFGSRYDIYPNNKVEKYIWGFDYFFFDKDLLFKFPKTDFCIGMPWWDYWVPLFLLSSKAKVKYLDAKVAFHHHHDTNYDNEKWIYFAKHFARLLFPNYYKSLSNDSQFDVFHEIDEVSEKMKDIANSLTKKSLDMILSKSKVLNYKIQEFNTLKFSVITPSYNSSKYIEETINSVLIQTYENYEHIIIDGNSTDGTQDILKNYPRIHWFSESDAGQSDAINKGLKLAKGDIIAWINSDDYYFDDKVFEKVAEYFSVNPDAKILIGDCIFNYMEVKPNLFVNNQEYDFEQIIRYWNDFIPPTQPTIFFKRELIDEFSDLDESLHLAMDYDLWLRITAKYPIHYINETLAVYRFIPTSKSGTGDDWSHFYPEWHKVYLRYKEKSTILPQTPLLSIIFPVINDDEYIKHLNHIILLIQHQIVKDLEILLISDFDCEDLIEEKDEYIIPIHLIKIKELNENKFIKTAQKYSKSNAIQFLNPYEKLNYKFFIHAVNNILDNPDFVNIKTKVFKINSHPLLGDNELFALSQIRNKTFLNDRKDIIIENELYFSVIIPTYNRAEVLEKALEALNMQDFDFKNFEVIVVDDGSNDNTQSMVNNFNANYDMKYIYQENSGPAEARNKAINAAKGKYLLILNDDTIAYPDLLSEHKKYHAKYANQKLAFLGNFEYIREAKVKPFTYFLSLSPMVFAYPSMQAENIYNYRYFWTCNISILRQAIIDVGMFDSNLFKEPMVEDTELGYRLEKSGYKVLYIPNAKSEHHHSMDVHGFIKRQQMSGRNIVKLFEKHPEILEKEQKLFGFSDLTVETLDKFREFINNGKEQYEKSLKFFDNIELLNIYNPNFIEVNEKESIKVDDLMNAINSHIWLLHLVNFYKGILKAMEDYDHTLKYDDSEPEPDNRHIIALEKIKSITSKLLNKTTKDTDELTAEDNNIDFSFHNETPKKKILMSMFGWNDTGGGTIFPKSVAIELAARGFDVTVLYAGTRHPISNEPYFVEQSIDSGVKLVGIYNRKFDFLMTDMPELEIKDNKILAVWEPLVRELQPDIVHFHNFLGLSFSIADIVDELNIPSFYTPHNYHIIDPELYMVNSQLRLWQNIDFIENSEYYKNKPEKAYYFNKRFEKAADILNNKVGKILAISVRVKELLHDFGINDTKIDVLYQAPQYLDSIERHFNNSDKLKVAYLGNIFPHKGLHVLLAASLIFDKNIELNIYGSGNSLFADELKKISKIANFKGAYSHHDFEEISHNTDIIVVPSIWEEGAGLVIQEAFAMGKPVIGARIGGIPEFVKDGVNGYTYPYNSPRNLASKINFLNKNKWLLEELANNSRPTTTFDSYIESLISYYEND